MFSKLEFANGVCSLNNFPARHFFTTTAKETKNPFLNNKFSDKVSMIPMHSDKIVSINNWSGAKTITCDGIITSLKNLPLELNTADCFPIMMSAANRKFIGLIHAGWRGTNSEIARKAVETATSAYNADPKDIFIGIGPGIQKCCYDNDQILRILGEDKRWHPFISRSRIGKHYINILDFNIKQLLDSGINPDNISVTLQCTCCAKYPKDQKKYLFFSHYRAAKTGEKEKRNRAIIFLA
jgi:YfiH family protein